MTTAKSHTQARLSKKFIKYVDEHPDDYPDAKAFFRSLDTWPEKAVRANIHVATIEELCSVWGIEIDLVPWCKDATYFEFDKKLGSTPEHAQGLCYVGDPSAMLALECAEVQPDSFVVDICAAPGGKSAHVINFLGPNGTLIANDVDPKRVKILRENLDRILDPIEAHLRPHVEVTNLSAQDLSDAYVDRADVVILDAPCSGEALMRRSNIARRQWSEKLIAKMAMLQKMLLAHSAVILKSGGKIFYSTCTFNILENEGVVKFGVDELGLQAASGVQVLELLTRKNSGSFVPGIEREFGVALFPHLSRGDGQTVSVLNS